jgi:carbon storage regulator
MLVLRRRAGESLLIGDDVEIEVLAITAQGAKIGIRAPRETVVLRKELKITQQQNEEAAQGLTRAGLKQAVEKLRSSSNIDASLR